MISGITLCYESTVKLFGDGRHDIVRRVNPPGARALELPPTHTGV